MKLARMKRNDFLNIGIFGGSFNPPHLGHLKAIEAAISACNLDLLYVIATNIPPHKTISDDGIGAKERFAMTQILCKDLEKAVVSDIEILRQGQSYTIDTVRSLSKLHPDANFLLFMGTDMLYCLEEWYEAKELCKLVTPVVFKRENENEEALQEWIIKINKSLDTDVLFVPHTVFPVSSTEIRQLLCKGMGREFLPEAVYAHIVQNRYYQVQADISWLWEKVQEILPQKRIAHIKGTEEEAVRLAKRWGADEKEAQVAAILHDITKYYTKEEHLSILEKYAMMQEESILPTVYAEHEKLHHAKSGASLAKMQFGVSDAVFTAIAFHTTGRENMSLLEKIIFLADYIEPNRDFPELEQLRTLAYENLDTALLFAFHLGLADLKEKGQAPHPDTQKAITFLEENMQKV